MVFIWEKIVFLFLPFIPCDPRAELAWPCVDSTPKRQIPPLKENLPPRIPRSAAKLRELA